MAEKPKLGIYWASSCGGCEIAVLNLHERILEVDRSFDLVFCPCLLDTKKSDVEALPEASLALTLFNGAVRTAENEEMAHLLRRKSRLLVAFGSCAAEGCIPALSNLHSREDHFRRVYLEGPSTVNPAGVVPACATRVPEGELHLPAFFERVRRLEDAVEVDYTIPGCPPESHQVWNVMSAVISGAPLPPPGSVLGAGHSTVCEECQRQKGNKKIARLHRSYELIPEGSSCLLEQGLLCMGVATRDGCGALCPQVNMPCTGCYGPPEGTRDQGAQMAAALAGALDLGGYTGLSEEETARRADAVLEAIPDFAGMFYKYSLAGSVLRGGRP